MTLFAELGDRRKLPRAAMGIVFGLLVLFAVNAKVAAYHPHQAALAATKIWTKSAAPAVKITIKPVAVSMVALAALSLLLFEFARTARPFLPAETPRAIHGVLLVPLAVRPPPSR